METAADPHGGRDRATDELSELAAVPVIALHPEMAETCKQKMHGLAAALQGGEVRGLMSALSIRVFIERMDISSAPTNGPEIKLFSSLAKGVCIATGKDAEEEAGPEGEWWLRGHSFTVVELDSAFMMRPLCQRGNDPLVDIRGRLSTSRFQTFVHIRSKWKHGHG